jgi:hypothetical protein
VRFPSLVDFMLYGEPSIIGDVTLVVDPECWAFGTVTRRLGFLYGRFCHCFGVSVYTVVLGVFTLVWGVLGSIFGGRVYRCVDYRCRG